MLEKGTRGVALRFPLNSPTTPAPHIAESIWNGTGFVIPHGATVLIVGAAGVDFFAFRNEDRMVLTLTWLSTAVMAPAAIRPSRDATGDKLRWPRGRNFVAARPHLERAGAKYEPLREEAICLMAEASLYAGKAADALYALNTLLMEQDEFGKPRSPRVRLLRGIAGHRGTVRGAAAGAGGDSQIAGIGG